MNHAQRFLELAMTDAEALKKAISKLGDDKTIADFVKYAEALRAVEALESGESAADAEPKAEEKPAEASAPALSAKPAEPVKLASDAAMGEAGAIVDALVAATGLDEGAVLAALRENVDMIAQSISGQPMNGTPAEDAAKATTAAASARVEALEVKLKAAQALVAEEQRKAREAESQADAARVDEAIRLGHILPAHREVFVALGRHDRAELSKQLTAAAGAPAVPVGTLVHAGPTAERTIGAKTDTAQLSPESETKLRRTLKNAGIKPERIEQIIAEQGS